MYVIAGASGNTGKVVASRLLQAGKPVRALVRSADKARDLAARGAEVVSLELGDRAGLTRALEGASGFYLLSPPNPSSSDFVSERRQLLASAAESARAAKVPHVVFLSSIAAHQADGTGIIQTARSGELALREAGLSATFIRAAYFVENWAAVLPLAQKDGVLPSFLPGDQRLPMVCTADIGALAAEALLEGPRGVRILELAGPRDLTPRDIAGSVGNIFGKPIQLVEAPLDAVVPTFMSFGISENVAALFRDMYAGFRSGRVVFEGGAAEMKRGTTSAEDTLRRLAQ